jgi:hypothetical protein
MSRPAPPPELTLASLQQPGAPLTVSELARLARRSPRLIRDDIRRGLLAAGRHVGTARNGRYMVPRDAALAWLRDVLRLPL